MPRDTSGPPPVLDVLILGAGISGIGCAAYLKREVPGKSWRILEMREDLGGTWDLFRYPGIRSDSDLYTFAYEFKPWESRNAIAGAAEIKAYIAETATENGIRGRIAFGRKVVACDWSSAEALWTVTTQTGADGARETWRARWIFSATGYYDYDRGFRPAFDGEEQFAGRIVHPQAWPEDLDHAGKRIAVIGSGATAVTLLPALAKDAAHVTQIQRTPTYVMPLPLEDPLAKALRPFLSKTRIHAILRRKNIWQQSLFFTLCQRYPAAMRKLIRKVNAKSLPKGFDVDTHFNPPYDPWDQRLCVVPGGDLFRTIRDGRADVVTGRIARFTATGIEMADGSHVEADIVVTATGLNLKLLGGAAYSVDGKPVTPSEHVIFKGMMLDGVPNLALSIGYTNSSWTLKVGLLCQYFCRLLAEMDRRGMDVCAPERPARAMALRPLLDFKAGYVQRSLDMLPRQGDTFPWEMTFNYSADARMMKKGRVIEPELKLSPAPSRRIAEVG
ncbi:FAD-containing monooxygenase EthA [Jannaschia seosinensis]|uniref:FAD-containing monooxygenase EthA n=1 Tax=Jannaschia seosinensis TaxID=313367 RepID=A0A0M7BEH3_9RHOB|nr:NAD(P)/FAD-dependent oxidoreductase [Jannaschia seosinensis]CUH40599.1 FAD-containing monooxygenase EthA [Jannaschia seosinensis]